MKATRDEDAVEQWRPVLDWEGFYEVSDLGRVRSLPRKGRSGRIIKLSTTGQGYLAMTLCNKEVQVTAMVHIMVAEAFYGRRPAGLEVRHLDGQCLNNLVSNLRFGTRSENMRDKRRHGTQWQLNKTHCPQGHEYSEENTYVMNNRRACITCKRAKNRISMQRARDRKKLERGESAA